MTTGIAGNNSCSETSRDGERISSHTWALFRNSVSRLLNAGRTRANLCIGSKELVIFVHLAILSGGEGNNLIAVRPRTSWHRWGRRDGRTASTAVWPGTVGDCAGQGRGGSQSGRADGVSDGGHSSVQWIVDDSGGRLRIRT